MNRFTTVAALAVMALLGGFFYWYHNYHPEPKRHLDAEARAMVQIAVMDGQYSVKNLSAVKLDSFYVTCDDLIHNVTGFNFGSLNLEPGRLVSLGGYAENGEKYLNNPQCKITEVTTVGEWDAYTASFR